MGKDWVGVCVASLLVIILGLGSVQAHEQKTITIILNEDGSKSGNISDPAFVQGNSIWFKMHDTTENATMQIGIDLDGDGLLNTTMDYMSPVIVESCELDDNGSLVDSECMVSATYLFPQNATVGNYQYWVMRDVNNITTNWTYVIQLFEDIHDDDGPNIGDCFGAGCDEPLLDDDADVVQSGGLSSDDMVKLTAVIAGLGVVFLTLSIRNERTMARELKMKEEE